MPKTEPPRAFALADPTEDTRERLLAAALRQFAERGFYGASIAQIAGELDLTKQALLYYFKRKEDLYAEVLKGIAERLLKATYAGVDPSGTPEEQFEGMIMGIYAEALARPDDTRVLLRELMDNQRRDAPAEKWYLKTWLDALVVQLDKVDSLNWMPFGQKFAAIYQMLSAIEYFVVSGPTLSRMYGPDGFAKISAAYPIELREQVIGLLNAKEDD